MLLSAKEKAKAGKEHGGMFKGLRFKPGWPEEASLRRWHLNESRGEEILRWMFGRREIPDREKNEFKGPEAGLPWWSSG